MSKPPVIAIVGPTSAGKTSLSIDIAQHIGGEVISADSRQVYQGMDLGTGKVTKEEMAGIPHHVLDVVDPMTIYTGTDFVRDASKAADDIISRDRCPIIAGGTFFYVDLLRGKLSAAPVEPDQNYRQSLEQYSDTELLELLETRDPRRAGTIDPHNRRRLVRALEIINTLGAVPEPTETESPYRWLTLGIDINTEELHHNIHIRLLQRIEEGMIDEVQRLHDEGVTWGRMDDLGLEYRYVSQYLQGLLSYDEMLTNLETRIKRFAKRQMTWLKKDSEIVWVDKTDLTHIKDVVDEFLSTT